MTEGAGGQPTGWRPWQRARAVEPGRIWAFQPSGPPSSRGSPSELSEATSKHSRRKSECATSMPSHGNGTYSWRGPSWPLMRATRRRRTGRGNSASCFSRNTAAERRHRRRPDLGLLPARAPRDGGQPMPSFSAASFVPWTRFVIFCDLERDRPVSCR